MGLEIIRKYKQTFENPRGVFFCRTKPGALTDRPDNLTPGLFKYPIPRGVVAIEIIFSIFAERPG